MSWKIALTATVRCFNTLGRILVPVNSRTTTVNLAKIQNFSINFSTSLSVKGLEEFFPSTDNFVEEADGAGRDWLASDLRQKSNEDLHKLWYVLLKERNLLLTLQHEANKFRYIIPAPERMRKVKKSMARIKLVIHERRIAVVEAKEELGLISAMEAKEEKMTEQKRKKHRKLRKRAEYYESIKKIQTI